MTLFYESHLAPDLKIMPFLKMLKNQHPATLAIDMSWTLSKINNLVVFWESSGPRLANEMFLQGSLKINVWPNWFWPWPFQNPNCPNDIVLWGTSGTRPQNHAVFKNVKKSASSSIGPRHELNNFQNCSLCFFSGQLWFQICRWYVFAWLAENQCLTEVVLAMTIPKPKLSQWLWSMGHIWHQTSKSCCL